jgi:hypothetical protein
MTAPDPHTAESSRLDAEPGVEALFVLGGIAYELSYCGAEFALLLWT